MRRSLVISLALAATLLGLYSCSMGATVATDSHGRVVRLSAVRLESTLPRVAVALLVDGCGLALRLRWSLDALSPAWLGEVSQPS